MVLATDESMVASILTYGKRSEIECLFACLKSKGFNFEDTRITKLDLWRNEQKKIKIKKHGRKAISYFRYGLDTLIKSGRSKEAW